MTEIWWSVKLQPLERCSLRGGARTNSGIGSAAGLRAVNGGRKTWQDPASAMLAVMTRKENCFTSEARKITHIIRN